MLSFTFRLNGAVNGPSADDTLVPLAVLPLRDLLHRPRGNHSSTE
jgi:hypothetical protein